MIYLYSGTPGSFKSYHAVAECLTALRRGKNVITNFPLAYEKKLKKVSGVYEYVDNMKLTVSYLIDFANTYHKQSVKAQTLIVIDEASIKFNSREFSRKDRLEWINFFANHRHFNFDIILIAQQDRMLDRQIRCLIETEYKHRVLKNYKAFGFILSLFLKGSFFAVEYWYPCSLRSGSRLYFFNKKIACCYDTMSLFVDSNNKLSNARNKNLPSEVKKIAKTKKIDVKEQQIRKNIVKFTSVLRAYIAQHGSSV